MTVFVDVAVQRTGNGTPLGVCVAIPAEIVEQFIDDDTKSLRLSIEQMTTGIHLTPIEKRGEDV